MATISLHGGDQIAGEIRAVGLMEPGTVVFTTVPGIRKNHVTVRAGARLGQWAAPPAKQEFPSLPVAWADLVAPMPSYRLHSGR